MIRTLPVLLVVVFGWAAAPAAARVHTSLAGVRMIERFEGYVPTPQGDPIGIPTVGFGSTLADVSPLPLFLTRPQAETLLRRSLARSYEPYVRALFGQRGVLHGMFNQHRFDALMSPSYNLGPGVLRSVVRSRGLHAIAARLLAYVHAGGRVLPGLVARRRAEAALLLKPMGRFELYPSAEAHLILSYDRLAGHTSAASHARRARLRAAMRAAAVNVARVARRESDWLTRRRLDRYRALRRRIA